MIKCLECDHWLQLANDGEDVCTATKDKNGDMRVIPIGVEVPDFCPIKNGRFSIDAETADAISKAVKDILDDYPKRMIGLATFDGITMSRTY